MSGFEVRDPDYQRRVRESFGRQGIMRHLGARLTALAPGRCEISCDFRPELGQQHGFFHAGVIGTIADSAGGYAGYTLMPHDSSVLTVEYKMNLMAPARGERIIARGEVIRAGRTLVIARADVAVLHEGVERTCATLLQTLMTMHQTPDGGLASGASSRESGAQGPAESES